MDYALNEWEKAIDEGKKAMREEEAKSARVDQLVTETVAAALRENAGIKVIEETQEEGQRVAREQREGVEMMSASKKKEHSKPRPLRANRKIIQLSFQVLTVQRYLKI